MFKIQWDKKTGGVLLSSVVTKETLNIAPRPVFYEELNLLGLNNLGWSYPECEEPLMWACNKEYYYRGEFVFEVKGANIYEKATVVLQPGYEKLKLVPVDMKAMLEKNKEQMFLCESEAIEFIRDVYDTYTGANRLSEMYAANQMDFEVLAAKQEKRVKQKMAIVKEDCDSFDIMPESEAQQQGKKVLQTTKIDYFLASFSGGKDSQVVLDLCTRALPPDAYQVIYSDTGYELPSSLELYEEVQAFYKKRFPTLKFNLVKNHESVLNYWDKIGTPSDTHRWCCTIMKTAPLYRSLKVPGTNKQAKVLTIDGVRAEESVKRANYERIGKGKHTNITNAHPILMWNNTEIYLYLFRYNLPINKSYRIGKSRVGCIICPFSTAWDDMVVKCQYPKEFAPFENRICGWAKNLGVKDIDAYMKDRKWKIKALGNKAETDIIFQEIDGKFKATVVNPNFSIYTWLPTIGDFTYNKRDNKDIGELKFQGNVYKFEVVYNTNGKINFTLFNSNSKLSYLLKRIFYKNAYCILCEACEVDCPHGALKILPTINIDKQKCKHCHKCLESHDRGCIAADCIRMINDTDKKMSAKVQAYKTFGLRETWISDYLFNPEEFWADNVLGPAQVDGFKAWLRDANIIDNKNKFTSFGNVLKDIYTDAPELSWEFLLTNLSYNSFIVNWFVNNVKPMQTYDKKTIVDTISDANTSAPIRTIENAVTALLQTFKYSPLGEQFNFAIDNKPSYVRQEYSELSSIGLAYSIYRFAEQLNTKSLRVSDFYQDNLQNSPVALFALSKESLEKGLRTLNSENNRVLIAELSMGLQHITLRDDITSENIIQIMLRI